MNSFLACATVAQSPTHAIVTAESLAALVGIVFLFFAYSRHLAAARDRSAGEFSPRVLKTFLAAWAVVAAAIPPGIAALSGTGWPSWSVCAPAPIVQCIAWFALGMVGIGAIVSRDTFAHLRERRAAGQPAFGRTAPMPRPYAAERLAPESQPAPNALNELLRIPTKVRAIVKREKWAKTVPLGTGRQQARAEAAAWARHGSAGRFLNSR